MQALPTTPTVERTPKRDRRPLFVAWLGTLVLSFLPQIVAVDILGAEPPPMRWIWLGIALLLAGVTDLWQPVRPLRGYFMVMTAVIVANFFLVPFLTKWTLADQPSGIAQALSAKAVFFAVALAMAAFLVMVLRRSPKESFLSLGKLSAASNLRIPGTRLTLSWAVLGTATTILLAAGFAFLMWEEGAFPADTLARLVPVAPMVIAAAAFNAFAEEVIFRSGPLAWLHEVVGPTQAVLMTSAWFGLGHYFGSVPSGPAGAIQAGLLALLLGKMMLSTKGLGWPLITHFAIDLVVFASIAMAIS